MSTRERAIPADLRDALASTRDVTVHKLPDGVAEGANDLRAWSQNRLLGQSGSSLPRKLAKRERPPAKRQLPFALPARERFRDDALSRRAEREMRNWKMTLSARVRAEIGESTRRERLRFLKMRKERR